MEMEDGVYEIIKNYSAYINEHPQLLSALYDIDMLPEQCRTRVGAIHLAAFCELWKRHEILLAVVDGAIEAIERGSTSAPILECLKAVRAPIEN